MFYPEYGIVDTPVLVAVGKVGHLVEIEKEKYVSIRIEFHSHNKHHIHVYFDCVEIDNSPFSISLIKKNNKLLEQIEQEDEE